MKKAEPNERDEFEQLLKKTREHAKKHNITQKDVEEAIKEVRAKNKR